MNSHCRIGSIRYKKAPNVVEVIPRVRGAEIPSKMREQFDLICEQFVDDGMAGMAIVAWGFDGTFSRATRIHKDSCIGQTLMPSVVAEILRRDTMRHVTRDVLCGDE